LKLIIANAEQECQGLPETAYITFPCTMDEIDQATKPMNLDDMGKGDFEIVDVGLGSLAGMLKQVPTADVNLKELNLLACQLNEFTEKQRAEYCAILTGRGELPVKDLINYAFDTAAGRYKIRYGVRDFSDLGRQFVKQEAPNLPHEIADNIYYTKVGYALEADGGKMTGIGFIENYAEHFKPNPSCIPAYEGDASAAVWRGRDPNQKSSRSF
jgi:hypothetical protein